MQTNLQIQKIYKKVNPNKKSQFQMTKRSKINYIRKSNSLRVHFRLTQLQEEE